MQPRAILWDVDGTLAETERDGHRVAFNRVFEEYGLDWHWDSPTYGRLLEITGGKERIRGFADEVGTPISETQLAQMHQRKNQIYAEIVAAGEIAFRDNVADWIQTIQQTQNLVQGIVTTTSRANLAALMTANLGAQWRDYFAVVVCGEDVSQKKPHPEAYQIALDTLGLSADQALAIEDSPNGLVASNALSIACLITKGEYFKQARFDGAWAEHDSLPPIATVVDNVA